MSSKVSVSVEVPKGKEILIKEHTPETGQGKRRVPASSKIIASFKTGKGKVDWVLDGHSFLTFEEFDHDGH